ncbi:hypothetical protein N8927_01115 [Crocinitomicaceae bacterium]|nr:hypothetical protein [Crocinitomicaceae bacterium]
MKKKQDILDHLKPELTNTPNNDYFEALASKIALEHPKSIKKNRIFPKIIGMSLAAAAVLIIAIVLFKDFSQPTTKLKVDKELFADINDEEISAYFDAHIDEFSLEDISYEISDEELGYENSTIQLDLYFSDISQEEIIAYIKQEHLDLDEFADELLIF